MPSGKTHQEALRAYLAQVRRHRLLEPDEERALARRARDGDRAAFQQLVNANLRFVVHVALRYRTYGFPLMDLVQEGSIGLVRAVAKFDPSRDVRLVHYASWWIRAYIHAYILRGWSLVKIGTTDAQRKLFFSLRKARRDDAHDAADGQVDDELSRIQRLARRCGVREDEVREMEVRMGSRDMSLSQPAGEEEGSASLEDFVPDEAVSPEDQVADREFAEVASKRLDALLDDLDERERFILERRVLSDEPLRLREVGHAFGVTRERARQIEYQARGKLRRRFADLEPAGS